MYDYVIIADTSSDMSAKLRQRYEIEDYLRGIIYYPDGHCESMDLDWEKMTPSEYYSSMKDKKSLYKTASVPVGNITETFEKYLKQGKDILSISISSALSTTYNETMMVADELMKKYPGRTIKCVDSLRYSTALAYLVCMASDKRKSGATLGETFEYIESKKHTIHQMGFMDDLFFLVKTGRLNNFKAFFGTLVGVNAMADFNRKGLSEVIIKAKGKSTAVEMILRYMDETIIDPENQIIFVAHTQRDKYANILAEAIKQRFSPKEVIINQVGMACGASIGPGLCAAFYEGKEISENLAEEKKLMSQLEAELKNRKKLPKAQ